MKTFSIEDIRSWNPCYDPSRYLPESWSGTVIDLLTVEQIHVDDRVWVVLREYLIDDKTLRLFSVWCARQVQHLITDERSINAIDVAEKYVLGQCSQSELDAARAAARAAASAAAMDAAMDAARAAARAAARDAAWAAAMAAAWDAARDAQLQQLRKMVIAMDGSTVELVDTV
jgi:membrane protease subunit (stomatin/prohibitin family)